MRFVDSIIWLKKAFNVLYSSDHCAESSRDPSPVSTPSTATPRERLATRPTVTPPLHTAGSRNPPPVASTVSGTVYVKCCSDEWFAS